MLPTARRFFAHARTPLEVSQLTPAEIDALILARSFHERKAQQIYSLAWRIMNDYGGTLPCEAEVPLSFAGIGPKYANLMLGIACGEARIGVDVHVHRVTNRWGYVQANTPEHTLKAFEVKLPRRYWVEINRLLAPFVNTFARGSGHVVRPVRFSTCVNRLASKVIADKTYKDARSRWVMFGDPAGNLIELAQLTR